MDEPGNTGNVGGNERMCSRCRERPATRKHRWCQPCQNDSKCKHPSGRRGRGNAGNGGNAGGNEGEIFRRALERIPRGDVTLVYRVILYDEAEELYRQLVRGIRRSPRFALDFIERVADRLHGRPTQYVVTERWRTTHFIEEGVQPPAEQAAAELVAATMAPTPPRTEAVDLADLPPALRVAPQALVVLPPPEEV